MNNSLSMSSIMQDPDEYRVKAIDNFAPADNFDTKENGNDVNDGCNLNDEARTRPVYRFLIYTPDDFD